MGFTGPPKVLALTRRKETAASCLFGFILFASTFATPSSDKIGFCAPTYSPLIRSYPAYKIPIPVDHFKNESRYEPHSNKYFDNRFWFDDTFYRPGGPVIVQNGGEITGVVYLEDMQIGLLHELARATNGLAVIFEHRYYGPSGPVAIRDPTDLRFLTTEQAMADQAYFARNVVFPGRENLNLTAPNTPWFAIGCSYPGALTAYERIQYPDLFWGAISSSGPTAPTADGWVCSLTKEKEYWNAVREYSPAQCVAAFGKIVNIMDNVLLGENGTQIAQLKGLFAYPGINATNVEFATSIFFPYILQVDNWIPCLDHIDGRELCRDLVDPAVLYPKAEKFRNLVKAIVANSGWAKETDSITTNFLNYVGIANYYRKDNSTSSHSDYPRISRRASKVDDFGSTYNPWLYQQCTEQGFFETGDAPLNTLPLVSRLVTLHHLKQPCRIRYGVNITTLPDTARLSKYGAHNLSYPRLMLVGGEADPWRPFTPLAARETPTRLNYSSTLEEPWYLIPGASHCWDFEGVFKSQKEAGVPPDGIKQVHELQKSAFKRWLREWHDFHPNYNVYAQQLE